MFAEDSFAVDFSCTTCGKIINALTCPSHCPQCQTAAPDHGFPTAEAVTIAEQNDCRVALNFETWRVERRILPLNARFQRLRVEFPRLSAGSLVEPCLRFMGKIPELKAKSHI